ncbi:MAG TPA: response regulator [Opitutaceae bacterium]|nr:response regulator [Opitutaceae bacterium]
MYLSPRHWVFVAFAFLHGVCFAHAPRVFRVEGLPEQTRQVNAVVQTSDGWVVGSAQGIAVTEQRGWTSIRTPGLTAVQYLVPFGRGLIAAGPGLCYYFEGGQWRDLHIDDTFCSAEAIGSSALISGHRGTYHVDADGGVKRVFTPSLENENYYVHVLGGQMYLFASQDGIFVWNENEQKLVSAQERFPWASGRQVPTAQELGDGRILMASSDGIFLEGPTGEVPLLQADTRMLLGEALISANRVQDTLVVSTYYGGLRGYNFATGELLWRVTPEQIGGTNASVKIVKEGLLIYATSGLYMMPEPSRFEFSSLPVGEISFAKNINGRTLIGLSAGAVVDENGVARDWPEKPSSMAVTPLGGVVQGLWGKLEYQGSSIELIGRQVYELETLESTRVVALQPEGVTIVDLKSSNGIRLELDSTANSIGVSARGILVGTSSGAVWFSKEGKLIGKFGSGLTHVGGYGAGCIAVDSERNLYNEMGQFRGTLPFSELLSVVEWKGKLCALVQTPDSLSWVGTFDEKFQWTPLDLPLPNAPTRLAVSEGRLLVVGPGLVLSVKDADRLGEPQIAVTLRGRDGRNYASEEQIPADENNVDLATPPGRFSPWRNPSLDFRISGGPWQDLPLGARVSVPRLDWGKTRIDLRSSWAGTVVNSELSIRRARPWWADWPGALLYALGVGALVWGGVRWRTARLELRASELEDVVEQRTAQLRKAQQAREEFFSMMSHEIRNPLNGVVGLCEIVENAPSNAVAPRERMLLKTLRGCADQLRSILDDILDFSRIDRGEIQLNEEVFEFVQAVEGAARAVDAGLTRCTLQLPEQPHWVRGDCGKMRQIVTNLVSNALKYGIPQAARLSADVTPGAGGVSDLRIRVLNTGPTIPAEELSRIFEGYVRGEDAKRRKISGTGLGLAVSRRIANAMGGSLDATSHEGLTEFRLELHLPEGTPPVDDVVDLPAEKTSRALGIEDEPYNRLVLGSILGQLGYEVDWASDGASALNCVRSGTYDLILTDFMLPDTNGVELAREMLTVLSDPKPPIIAVTAYSTPEKMEQAKAAGITGFVTKPVSKRKIQAAIMSAVGGFAAKRSIDVRTVDCDFTMILRLKNGRQQLAEYADDLPRVWARVLAMIDSEESVDESARAVHAFRSRVLAVQAMNISEQLSLLEDAVLAKRKEDTARLVSVIAPMLDDLAEAARDRALGQTVG